MTDAPAPRKCETERCDHLPAVPKLDPKAIDQTCGPAPAWVFECPFGWRRVEPMNNP